jgi:alanine racemase
MDAKHAPGEPRLLISRSALRHNLRLLRNQVGRSVRICAIVKADAYGLGAAGVVDSLCNFSETDEIPTARVDELAVATIDEANALPETELPTLILRPVENVFIGRERARLETALRAGWSLTLCSRTAADDLARIAVSLNRRANIQILMDTGMARGGVRPGDLDDLVAKIESLPSLRLTGIFSHFVHGEAVDHEQTRHQTQVFRNTTDPHAARLNGRLTRHMSNSGGVFFADAAFDMVRPGISLYGIDPTCRPSVDRPLRPVVKWLAPLVDVRDIRAGETVGYNGAWTAKRDTRLGLVPVGYADGYPRALSGKAVTLVHGRPAPVVGRVSMDLLTVDLTDIPSAVVGDDVTLVDSDPLSPASLYEMARLADTIPYELLCKIGARVRRMHVDPVDATESPKALRFHPSRD